MFLSGIQRSKYQLNFHLSKGLIVATKKDQNNNDSEISLGKKSIGNIVPTKILFEKSGAGNNSNPNNNPTNMEIMASTSLIFFI